MLLKELLDKRSTKIKHVERPVKTTAIHSGKHEELGVGYQTVTYFKEKFPNKVVKWAQVTGTNDPTYQFLRMCVNNQQNPYLPRIYAIKYYANPHKDYHPDDVEFKDEIYNVMTKTHKGVLIYVTEKLSHIKNNNITNVEQYGIDSYIQDFIRKRSKLPSDYKFSPSFLFFDAFKHPEIRKEMVKRSTDVNFKKLMRLLEPLFHNFASDTHKNNFMMRDDGHLVFVDPITYKE